MIEQPVQEQIDLENIKNQITLSEGELLRLKNLRTSEEYSIAELVKEKKYRDEQLAELKDSYSKLTNELQALETELKDAHDTLNQAATLKDDLAKERQQLQEDKIKQDIAFNGRDEEASSREDIISSNEKNHALAHQQLMERQASLISICHKIDTFGTELQSELSTIDLQEK